MVLHTSTGKIVVLLVAGLLTVVSAAPASAAAGDPDLTFSQDGKLTTDFGSDGDIAHAVAVQTDGRIVVAGQALGASSGDYEFALVRYLANGNRDVTFGRNGKVTTGFSRGSVTFNDVAYGVAVQPADGKIVAAGWAGPYLALARYKPNGSLDPAFGGGNGRVMVTFGFAGTGNNVAHDVAIQPGDGKIVVAGEAWNGTDFKVCVARFNTDGSLDSTFDGDGKVMTTFGAGSDRAYGLVIQPSDGKIVVAGSAWNGSNYDFALARYDTAGTLDPGFAGNGKKKVGFLSSLDLALGVALHPANGTIVAAGGTFDGLNWNFALARFDPSGLVLGKVTTDFGSVDSGEDVAIQPTTSAWLVTSRTSSSTRCSAPAER